MGLKVGIIGLPNVGKSTIFNALTKLKIAAENYAFCTIDPNIGIVNVPDVRLNNLAKIYNPKNLIHTTIEFVDIAGLVKGASKGEGLGNKFLSHIRDVDAIVHVIRLFADDNISHIEGKINPKRDIEIIETELLLKDIETIENRLNKLTKKEKYNKDFQTEFNLLKLLLPKLNNGILVRDIEISDDEKKNLQNISLLTIKPMLYVANLDEESLNSANSQNRVLIELEKYVLKQKNNLITICGDLEYEISLLSESEKKEYIKEFNLKLTGLEKLIQASYKLLKLQTFFTAGQKEVKAWTIKKNTLAPKAASEIHSDIEKGFIKAEVFTYEDIIETGSEIALKENGKIRQEGKNYIVNDGDIIFFKFNV